MDRLLHSVTRLAHLARREVGLPATLQALGEELAATLGADEAHVCALADGRPATAVLVTVGGGAAEYVPAGAEGDALSWVARTGRGLAIPDARVPGVLPAGLADARGLAAAVVLPVPAGEDVRAVALAGVRTPRPSGPAALRAAAALCEIAGAAFALRDARQAAAVDALTGCLNHGAMLDRLAQEIARARRQGSPLSVMILDLDDFKHVNDTYGHPTGDELLRHVGDALRREFRSFDQVARYGGDEFVVILPNVGGPGAEAAGHRALTALRGIHIARGDGRHDGITVSLGVAEWAEPENAGELLERADTALRRSKAAGKDGLARA